MKKKPLKIAIVGTGRRTKDEAPYDDLSWQIWSPALYYNDLPRLDVGFEIHRQEIIEQTEGYSQWLKNPPIPVFMRDQVTYPKSKPYPFGKAVKLIGGKYFASSFGFIIAKAILDGATEIGLYGIDLTQDEEYSYQRPNAEYLIGIARGMGIKVHIPEKSALCKFNHIYGESLTLSHPAINDLEERLKTAQKELRELQDQENQMVGVIHELEETLKLLKDYDRGMKK